MEAERTSEIARHWINGEWVSSTKISDSLNPSTGQVLGRFADGGAEEAKTAIAAARRAFDEGVWASDRALRAAALNELAQRLEERASRLSLTLARELGKVISQSRMEATVSPLTLRHIAGTALAQMGSTAEIAPGLSATTWRDQSGRPALSFRGTLRWPCWYEHWARHLPLAAPLS